MVVDESVENEFLLWFCHGALDTLEESSEDIGVHQLVVVVFQQLHVAQLLGHLGQFFGTQGLLQFLLQLFHLLLDIDEVVILLLGAFVPGFPGLAFFDELLEDRLTGILDAGVVVLVFQEVLHGLVHVVQVADVGNIYLGQEGHGSRPYCLAARWVVQHARQQLHSSFLQDHFLRGWFSGQQL